MKIITDNNLNPNVVKYLQEAQDKDLFYRDYGLKHPLALYNTSFNKIEDALRDFFKIYDSLKVEDFTPTESNKKEHNNNDKGRELLKVYRIFLYSLREYLDDCFHVMKAFVRPQSHFKDDRNQCAWLKKNIPSETSVFFDNIKDYKNYLDNIVNQLKHKNGILSYIVFYNETNREFHVGYFVANIKNDAYEPVDYIHKEFQGQHTAFSFNRDIRYNIFNVFLVSEEIVEFLKRIGIKLNSSEKSIKAPDRRTLLYKKIMDMPKVFFPDEYSKDVPSVCLLDDGSLKLEYPSKLSLKKLTCDKILLTHSGDGKTREFKILYYKGKK